MSCKSQAVKTDDEQDCGNVWNLELIAVIIILSGTSFEKHDWMIDMQTTPSNKKR